LVGKSDKVKRFTVKRANRKPIPIDVTAERGLQPEREISEPFEEIATKQGNSLLKRRKKRLSVSPERAIF
jgi:hypothetical protein